MPPSSRILLQHILTQLYRLYLPNSNSEVNPKRKTTSSQVTSLSLPFSSSPHLLIHSKAVRFGGQSPGRARLRVPAQPGPAQPGPARSEPRLSPAGRGAVPGNAGQQAAMPARIPAAGREGSSFFGMLTPVYEALAPDQQSCRALPGTPAHVPNSAQILTAGAH